MTRTTKLALNTAILAGATLAITATASAEEPEPIAANPLTERHAFPNETSMQITQNLEGLPPQSVEIEDTSHMVMVEFTIQPGVVFPWHTHPGTVLIKIAEGDFTFVFAEDCVERDFAPGSALVDPGDTVHTAFNPSADQETVVVATLFGVPAEGPLTIPVEAAEGAALDEECGIERLSG
ncbi:Cupin domain protein [Salinihabitans flavidus]|uniref:Cupin domain protein n=1 Tax=Salinihabitans flavidus TaxID=569882 RepID=A0A1H8W978_9RHOB|nr:cupin domain-containing protein [Salinihabitans flavidus]SEP24083.1 Cupin domain protein [Salinihabitans flavidus]